MHQHIIQQEMQDGFITCNIYMSKLILHIQIKVNKTNEAKWEIILIPLVVSPEIF